nr:EOG090X03LH [Cyclestheria hislopi]
MEYGKSLNYSANPFEQAAVSGYIPVSSSQGKKKNTVFRSELNVEVGQNINSYSGLKHSPNQRSYENTTTSKGRAADTLSLIDFSSPSNSPVKTKTNVCDKRPATMYAAPVSRHEDTVDSSLPVDFSLLNISLCNGIEIGSAVEVTINNKKCFGIVQWYGNPENHSQFLVGVELDEDIENGTDGTHYNKRYFNCPPGRAVFVSPEYCKRDSRFDLWSECSKLNPTLAKETESEMEFGGPDCPPICGVIAPVNHPNDIAKFVGKYRGIQGHHNSCYLDATLFSMFTFTSVFDSLLYRPPTQEDIPQYSEVQRILRDEIVNPLRQHFYVRADKIMKLRRLLEKLSSVKGLTNEEKDPEEFLHCLLSQTLRAEPFLKLNSGQEAYHHQLFVEKDEKLSIPTVQQLFEQSFLSSGIKLKEIPSCLIIQMPRFGKSYKMYPHVIPSAILDITDVLENSPRHCIVCGSLAQEECQDCLGQFGTGLESIAFCSSCLRKVHSHKNRTTHQGRPLKIPADYAALQEHCNIPRLYMELFAVVCIETSHYVAFVKCGLGPDAPWCFFNSMADRKGEQNGYNIPETVPCPDLPRWLTEDVKEQLLPNPENEYMRRLFSDAYMCLYQSQDLTLYR